MKILIKGPLDSDLVKCGFRPGQIIDVYIEEGNKSANFTSSYNGIPQNCAVWPQNYDIVETSRPALDPNFLEIECLPTSTEFKIFEAAVDMGIDSHIEGFIKSKFGYRFYDSIGLRAYFNFHVKECHILIRRMQELRPQFGGSWPYDLIGDIQESMNSDSTE